MMGIFIEYREVPQISEEEDMMVVGVSNERLQRIKDFSH
jgi:hypothetical protein